MKIIETFLILVSLAIAILTEALEIQTDDIHIIPIPYICTGG